MANISTIKLPDNSSYTLQDNSTEKSGHIHDSTSIVPIISKTFTGIIGSGTANWANGTFFFGSVRPTSFTD
jgi:hypothetical protein